MPPTPAASQTSTRPRRRCTPRRAEPTRQLGVENVVRLRLVAHGLTSPSQMPEILSSLHLIDRGATPISSTPWPSMRATATAPSYRRRALKGWEPGSWCSHTHLALAVDLVHPALGVVWLATRTWPLGSRVAATACGGSHLKASPCLGVDLQHAVGGPNSGSSTPPLGMTSRGQAQSSRALGRWGCSSVRMPVASRAANWLLAVGAQMVPSAALQADRRVEVADRERPPCRRGPPRTGGSGWR